MILKGLYFMSCNIGKAEECKRDIYQKDNNGKMEKKKITCTYITFSFIEVS